MDLLTEKKNEVLTNQTTLKRGSVKIVETNKMVAQLKIDLKEAQPQLELQNKLTEETLVKLKASSAIAEEKTEIAEKEAEQIQNKKDQIQMITDQANSKLADSLPRIIKAEDDVRGIERKQLVDLRIMKAPPDSIIYIFRTVSLILGERFDDWKTSATKLLLSLEKFMDRLVDKLVEIKTEGSSVVPESTLKLLSRNLNNEYFSEQKLASSTISGPLGNWCKAIYEFTNLKKSVEPLEKNAAELNAKLDIAAKEYEKISSELSECKGHFEKLKSDFDELQAKKEELEKTIQNTEVKLDRAEKLNYLLAEEGTRWEETVKILDVEVENVVGNVLLASTSLSYLGPLTGRFRGPLLQKWTDRIEEIE